MSAAHAESPVRSASPKKPQRRSSDNAGDKTPSGADTGKTKAKLEVKSSATADSKSDAKPLKKSAEPKSDAKPSKAEKAEKAEKADKSDSKSDAKPVKKAKEAKPEAKPVAETPEAKEPKAEARKPEAPRAEEAPKAEAHGKKKPGSSSKAAKRPRAIAPVKSGPPVALIALLLAVAAGAGVGSAVYVASSPTSGAAVAPGTTNGAVAPAPAAPETPAATAPAAPAATPSAVDVNGPVIAAALRELGAGREREAMDLLSACKTTPEVEGVRERIQLRSREALVEEGEKLKRLARQGKETATQLARLRTRLPESLKGELDKLAVALKRELGAGAPVEEEATASTTRTRPARSDQRPADPSDREPNPTPAREEEEPKAEEEPEPIAKADEPERETPRARPEAPAAKPERKPTPPAAAPESEPEPTPEPSPAPAGDDLPGAPEADQGDAVLKAALAEVLHVQHSLRGGVVDVNYGFDSDGERQDFDFRGNFDKAEINRVFGAAGGHSGSTDLELGVGSRGTAKMEHTLDLAGDFEIDMTLWTAYSGGRSQFFMSVGKIGVRWGEQLVKVAKTGSIKPLSPEPDRMSFREERDVTIRMVRKGDELTVSLNGRTVAKKTFEPADLDGRFSVFCSDVRLVITNLRIKGKVDGKKL